MVKNDYFQKHFLNILKLIFYNIQHFKIRKYELVFTLGALLVFIQFIVIVFWTLEKSCMALKSFGSKSTQWERKAPVRFCFNNCFIYKMAKKNQKNSLDCDIICFWTQYVFSFKLGNQCNEFLKLNF